MVGGKNKNKGGTRNKGDKGDKRGDRSKNKKDYS